MSPRFKGWHSRGYLPHYDRPNTTQFVTFRLHDSVPSSLLGEWRKELGLHSSSVDPRDPQTRDRIRLLEERIARFEDEGHGACWLARSEIAEVVTGALVFGSDNDYTLRHWCVMPNHVHCLVRTLESMPLARIVARWKGYTAKQINRTLGRTGPVWFPEYYDRFMRDAGHTERTIEYIRNNPVRAGLCSKPADWRHSSAFGK